MPYNWDAPFEIRDIRNGEWYWVQKEVLSSSKLNASDKLVYSALAYYANNKTQQCYPSYTRICELIKLSRPTVIKGIQNLIKHNFISRKKREGKVNYYEMIKVTSQNSLPVKNSTSTSKKENLVLVKNSTTNNTYIKQELFNNTQGDPNNSSHKKDVDRIVNWAYTRALGQPSMPEKSFREGVEKAIARVGYERVHEAFVDEVNALRFFAIIKDF